MSSAIKRYSTSLKGTLLVGKKHGEDANFIRAEIVFDETRTMTCRF